jgi:hypothetical protein
MVLHQVLVFLPDPVVAVWARLPAALAAARLVK